MTHIKQYLLKEHKLSCEITFVQIQHNLGAYQFLHPSLFIRILEKNTSFEPKVLPRWMGSVIYSEHCSVSYKYHQEIFPKEGISLLGAITCKRLARYTKYMNACLL